MPIRVPEMYRFYKLVRAGKIESSGLMVLKPGKVFSRRFVYQYRLFYTMRRRRRRLAVRYSFRQEKASDELLAHLLQMGFL